MPGRFMDIDWEAIRNGRSLEDKRRIALGELRKCDGHIVISDCLANKKRDGVIFLEILDSKIAMRDHVPRYKLRILRDQWGDPPVPGEDHVWRAGTRNRDEFGRKMGSLEIRERMRRGDNSHLVYHSAVIDQDGCITVPYEDAAMLLNHFGVHYSSGEPLTGLREMSREPTKRASDGAMKIQHNWRYVEVPPWESPAKLDAPKKRGRPAKVQPVDTENNDGFPQG